MRALFALAALGWTTAAHAEPPPLPAPLEGVVVDGEFQPGDLGWLRGRFADATDADKARLAEVKGWLERCTELATEAERTELTALGEDAGALSEQTYGEPICESVEGYLRSELPTAMTFEEFVAAMAEVRPILAAWVAGGRTSAEMVIPTDKVASPILRAVAADQALRKAFDWDKEGGPQLSGPLTAVLRLLVGQRVGEADRASTAMLRTLVAKHGWPTIDGAGKQVASGAWLLVQHADQDPSWQVEALRLLQPLAARNQISTRDVAYLTDRVRVNVTGRQTYGTQFHCVDGHNVPRPIDDEAAVDERRAAAELPPLAESKQMMEQLGDWSCTK